MPYRGNGLTGDYDSGREERRRVIAGLSGLVVMLLLVMLAGLLTGQAREEAEVAKAQAEAAGVPNPGGDAALPPVPSDPLAAAPTDDAAVVPAAPVLPDSNSDGVTVPDLQPDPQLKAAPAAQ